MDNYPAELYRLNTLGFSDDQQSKIKGPIRLDARGHVQSLDTYLTFVDDSTSGDLAYEYETSWPTIASKGKYLARDYAPYAKGDLITQGMVDDLVGRDPAIDDVWVEFFVIRRGAAQFAYYVHNMNMTHLTKWHPVLDAMEAVPSMISGRKGTYGNPGVQLSAANMAAIFQMLKTNPNIFYPTGYYSPAPYYDILYHGKEVGGQPCLAAEFPQDLELLGLTAGDPAVPGWNNPDTHAAWRAIVARETAEAQAALDAISAFTPQMVAEGLDADYADLLAYMAAAVDPLTQLIARNESDLVLEPAWAADFTPPVVEHLPDEIPPPGGWPPPDPPIPGHGAAERSDRAAFLHGIEAAGLNASFGPGLPQADPLYLNRWYWFERCVHRFFGSKWKFNDFDYVTFIRGERESYAHLEGYIVDKFGVGY